MNGKFLLSALFLFSLRAFGQHEYDVWYFGQNAGIDFTPGAPVVLYNGLVNTTEGSASISDSSGNLLFYTDGLVVRHQNHMVMANGTNLHGGGSSSQSALIIKMPGSDSLYYIFTTGEQTAHGFSYSIVDITLQSGLGEVIEKNVSLLNVCTEKLTAARHSNGTDYWILVHGWQDNNFYAYQFSDTGVNVTPVVTAIGTFHDGNTANCIGYMRASHNSRKIALCLHEDNYFELFDFDNGTGIISNDLFIDGIATSLGPYGIEFSPNDSLLYGAEYSPGVVLQWDISSGNDSIILASQIQVGSTASTYGGALALASDGKIYMAKHDENWLSAIEYPNVYGTGCNFIDNALNLAPRNSKSGLPNIPPYWFGSSLIPPLGAFISSSAEICASDCIDFTDQSANNPASWEWSFPGGMPSSSTDQNPSGICYFYPGQYDVTLIVSNGAGSDTLVSVSLITVNALPVATITQSNDTLFSSAGNSYQWNNNGNPISGATDYFYVAATEDFYSVVITDNNGCTASDTIFFSLSPFSGFSASTPFVCEKFCIDFFDATGNNPVSWQWEFEQGIPSTSILQNPTNICYDVPGVYDVTLITGNSYGSDTLIIPDYVTVYPTPPFPVITQNGNVLTSTSADFYQWQLNAVNILGATNQSYSVTQSGYYTIVITDLNGCVNSASADVLLLGIEDELMNIAFTVYPDPSNGNFIVEVLYHTATDPIVLRVMNAIGQEIFSCSEKASAPSLKKEVYLQNSAPGIYFLKIENGKSFLRKKIIIHP